MLEISVFRVVFGLFYRSRVRVRIVIVVSG